MRLLASDLACIRGGREVFAGLNLAVDSGEALAISGPNGAGKSSLLRLIAGLVHPTGGMLTVEGGDPELTVGEQSHYLGHLDALKPALSVHENLAFWAKFLGGGPSAVGLALAAVGLDRISTLPAAYLSAGQRRRLSIARLIAVKRPIWLLDEPTSALDATAQAVLATLMSQHRAGGGMILAAVHGPIGLEQPAELRLGSFSPSPPGGEGRGGGWGGHAPGVRQSHELNRASPTPDPSPQGGGEKKPPPSPGGERP